jgi:hypothetical protein
MNAPKHTPGPWRYLPNLTVTNTGEPDGYAYPYLVYAGSEFVAQVATDQMCEESRDEENARLIAAAPDMLAALQTLQRWIIPGTAAVFSEELVSDLGAVIKAAVNKAMGDAS